MGALASMPLSPPSFTTEINVLSTSIFIQRRIRYIQSKISVLVLELYVVNGTIEIVMFGKAVNGVKKSFFIVASDLAKIRSKMELSGPVHIVIPLLKSFQGQN